MRAACLADLILLWSPLPFWLDGITVKAGQLEALDPFVLEINKSQRESFLCTARAGGVPREGPEELCRASLEAVA